MSEAPQQWPTRGPDFNRWNENVALFAQIIRENPGLWLADHDLKYLNLRVDTRSGAFLLTCRDVTVAISPDRVVDAARKARSRGMNKAYADVTEAVLPADTVRTRPETTPELLAKARQLVLEKPSTSYIQRKLMIGFNHACEIMEQFEAEGLVSERRADGTRTIQTGKKESA